MNRNPSRLQPDVRTLAILAAALAVACARVDPPVQTGAALAGPPGLALTVHQWFWRGLGMAVAAIVTALIFRSVVIRKMRRTLASGATVAR